jgi:hypothetical protein
MCGARNGQVDIVQILLAHGADKNVKDKVRRGCCDHTTLMHPLAAFHLTLSWRGFGRMAAVHWQLHVSMATLALRRRCWPRVQMHWSCA